MILQVVLSGGEVLAVCCGVKLFSKAGSRRLSWGLRVAALLACPSWFVLWGPSVPLVVFRAAVWARQPCCSKALWLALCVQGRGAAGPSQGCS